MGKERDMEHSFAICAYGDSPYLESCIKSLTGQSVESEIIICTSTPSDYIDMMGEKYDIPVYVRQGAKGIGYDWNFAYGKAKGRLVTIAHQDDMYHHDYTKVLLENKKKYPDMSVFTTASATIKNGKLEKVDNIAIVKGILRIPLRIPAINNIKVVKKAAITLGNPIICPSCTYDRELCGENIFNTDYRFVLDWELLHRLAEKPGRFICVEKPLIMYRVHSDSATGHAISDSTREREESEMFDRSLPQPLSDIVKNAYKKSYSAYEIEE